MTRDLRPGDLVEFGPGGATLSGEVSAVSDGGVVVIVADFMGRRVPFTVTDLATVRRVPPGLVRRSG